MGSSFAAGSGADMLQQIIRDRAIEAYRNQALKQQAAEAAARQELARAQLAQQQHEQTFRESRAGVDDQRYADQAPMRLATVSHLNAETEGLNRAPTEAEKARAAQLAAAQAQRDFTGWQNDLNRQNAVRIANINSVNALNVAKERGAGPKVQQVHAVGPDGRKVIKLVDVNTGNELGQFDAGMSQEDFIAQLQREAAARAQGTAEGKQAAGSGGLLDLVAGVFGGGKGHTATPGAKTIRARDPQGGLHEAATGTPLPAGWKLEQ